MPLFDYKCNNCGTVEETQDPLPGVCTLCNYTMVRIWSAPAVHFKGTGFYSTGG
jgi:putative FmdB family regulatory protein